MQALGKIEKKKSLIISATESANPETTTIGIASGDGRRGEEHVSILFPWIFAVCRHFLRVERDRRPALHGSFPLIPGAVSNDFNSNAASQETLSTLAATRAAKLSSIPTISAGVLRRYRRIAPAYYVLGFTSSNSLKMDIIAG